MMKIAKLILKYLNIYDICNKGMILKYVLKTNINQMFFFDHVNGKICIW